MEHTVLALPFARVPEDLQVDYCNAQKQRDDVHDNLDLVLEMMYDQNRRKQVRKHISPESCGIEMSYSFVKLVYDEQIREELFQLLKENEIDHSDPEVDIEAALNGPVTLDNVKTAVEIISISVVTLSHVLALIREFKAQRTADNNEPTDIGYIDEAGVFKEIN